MIPAVEGRVSELSRICFQYGVRRLDLFGSAANGQFDPSKSDLDFLVEFRPDLDSYADAYFGLLDSLGDLFERHIDLVMDSAIRNPYFRRSVEQTKVKIYEA